MIESENVARLPLSQDFHSVQGEGSFVGAQMHFIRVAGCNVGVFPSIHQRLASPDKGLMVLQQANPSHSICTSALGQKFLCDTEYNKVISRVCAPDVIEATWEDFICITGGEPFLYPCLKDFVDEIVFSGGIRVHIETSGTLPIDEFYEEYAWITCSPKAGFLMENRHKVNEFKFVVDRNPTPQMIQSIVDIVDGCEAEVFLQSVNGIDTVDSESTAALLTILKQHPSWRLSVQLHKILGVD